MSIQQMLLGVGAVATKTYVDDVFSTFLYTGSGSSGKQIVNNIDLSNEGGMVWLKNRSSTGSNTILDTVRTNGFDKSLYTDTSGSEVSGWSSTANSNGFTLGQGYTNINGSGETYASWTFRKAPGFFDVVTWTGNGSNRTIAHSLGSIPGMIMIKNLTDSGEQWAVGHRGIYASSPWNYYMWLNTTNAQIDDSQIFNDTAPTSSVFSIGTQERVNKNGSNYVAYVFAGGESTQSEAVSVDFDGTGDYLSLAASSDWEFTGEFCIEYWIKPDVINQEFPTITWGDGAYRALFWNGTDAWRFQWPTGSSNVTMGGDVYRGQWQHHALTRDSSNNLRFFINGTLIHTSTQTSTIGDNAILYMGYKANVPSKEFEGQMSNVRIVKGSAVYTSSFKPTYEPLTNITNTKLLCCNNSSVTGKTVGGTITANGDPTASTDSPFDDPAAFTFGDAGDQNVIKCGSYVGSGSTTLEVNLGWEPSWVLIKQSSGTDDWMMFDSMRGIVSEDDDAILKANTSAAENDSDGYLDVTPTGFKLRAYNANGSGDTYIFCAIRRPDGYCGKPVELGTDVFAMDTGNGSSTIPTFDSGFPVDFALVRGPSSGNNWTTGARFIQGKYLLTNSNAAAAAWDKMVFDSNAGWMNEPTFGSNYQSWMWKRHAGMDVVAYEGNGLGDSASLFGHDIPHGLSKTPEMIWVKYRNSTYTWQVYHKGLNGGTTPENYKVELSETDAESSNVEVWKNAPTSTHFTVGSQTRVNADNGQYIAMLFASTDVSKVGYYTGNGSTQTITTGFQPRFAIIRRVDGSEDHWVVLDTTRGWGSGNDNVLKLNSSAAQSAFDAGAPTSTGFSLTSDGWVNYNTGKFIYYAHA